MKNIKKIAAGLLAAVITASCSALPVSAYDYTNVVYVAKNASSGSLAAPTNIRTSMSKGAMTVSWKKVTGATVYKVEVKYPGKQYKTLKTVSSTKVKVPYLKNGDKVTVRITPMKKKSSGYTKGTPAAITKTFKCEKMYIDSNNVFGIDTSLLGMSLSQLEDALDQELELYDAQYWDMYKYVAYPMIDDTYAATVLFDKNKKVGAIFVDIPLDEWDGNLYNSIKQTYGTLNDAEPEDRDFHYYCDVNSKVGYEVFEEVYGNDDSDEVVRQALYLL